MSMAQPKNPIPMQLLSGIVAVVEDDIFMRRALERAIAAYGYRVKGFSSAEQYLEDVAAGEIACAIIDIDLGPGLSGLDLATVIGAGPQATPFVLMSGSCDAEMRDQAWTLGCIDFLDKPFMTSQVVAAIMSLEVGDD
jgi:two-component system response regulator TtrR